MNQLAPITGSHAPAIIVVPVGPGASDSALTPELAEQKASAEGESDRGDKAQHGGSRQAVDLSAKLVNLEELLDLGRGQGQGRRMNFPVSRLIR
jgi:hypothetical protein